VDLCVFVAKTEGLEQCEPKIADLLNGANCSPSEVLISLLSGLAMLPFEAQVACFESFYASQEQRLESLFMKADARMPWMPTIPLEHGGVTSDGCGKCPVTGLRFKCKACPDYDLCGECFASKGLLHGGECSEHVFELKVFPSDCGMWAAKGKGKGKGKFKGMGKGKCGGKRSFDEVNSDPECEAKPEQAKHFTADDQKPLEPKPSFDLSFPVVVEDGRRLTIAWKKTHSPQQVAESFAAQHGIPAEEVPTICAFVGHATAWRPMKWQRQREAENDRIMQKVLEQVASSQ
jgi:hypothetical protein